MIKLSHSNEYNWLIRDFGVQSSYLHFVVIVSLGKVILCNQVALWPTCFTQDKMVFLVFIPSFSYNTSCRVDKVYVLDTPSLSLVNLPPLGTG
jgi:hypothetical protein